MTRQHGCGGKSAQIASGWRASLATVLNERNGARHDGAVASYATRYKRSDVLYAGFARLRELGYKLDTVTSLRGTHIAKLMQDGHARGLSASTLQNTLSIFRTFAEWIGKAGMVRGIEHYLGGRDGGPLVRCHPGSQLVIPRNRCIHQYRTGASERRTGRPTTRAASGLRPPSPRGDATSSSPRRQGFVPEY
jgi:Phage integrase, N-terminal